LIALPCLHVVMLAAACLLLVLSVHSYHHYMSA